MTERKRLEGNGLWESSRMMLPEHKVAINIKSKEEGRKFRPTLDNQELELIENALAESFHEHRTVKIQIFDEYEDKVISGIVVLIQTFRREIKLTTGIGEWEWIKIDEVVSVK
ncbi:YolD-like family protein [Paenibacillus glucanolyticus]|uniref:YolD-like family protein n=1 Tax=Paenibacillus glucanolyticus TaxID=59843 RepID=UPI00096D4F23|nr:YolD-like family protein [Paenibacillus glucanolyticus]OMF73011.1 hypothetical protein BK142_19265 [Paenibacillus glucanolyticus]